ncbi:MAG: DNA ligase-1 [Alphaproteobacteria bacterium]|jgi:DNA ligase-1
MNGNCNWSTPLCSYTSRFLIILAQCIFAALAISEPLHAEQRPIAVQLAEVYENENIQAYLVSEKYDGIRAIWKNKEFRTRNGHVIHAPKWFTEGLPDVWLDGELWYKHNSFEFVASAVTKHIPANEQWQHITYMVFDAPNKTASFNDRFIFYTALLQEVDMPHIQAVEQHKIENNHALMAMLEQYTKEGAEGLMLQKAKALFSDGRSGNLLKLKKHMDAEATILKYLPGKGKYKGIMGSLLVEHINDAGINVQFKIGTGFSDDERHNPPAIGGVVTFAYHGYTKRGLPRFASFIRVRNSPRVLKLSQIVQIKSIPVK